MKNRLIVILLTLFIIGAQGPLTVFAQQSSKIETVYGIMDAKGNVENVYIVNELDMGEGDSLIDYGSYDDIRKLTFNGYLDREDNKIQITTDSNPFYYQGRNKSRLLPWIIEVEYYLNVQEMEPESLAGKNGALDILINIKKNEELSADYFDKYMIQASVSLATKNATDVTCKGGTVTKAGGYSVVTIAGIPGENLRGEIRGEVTDFTMPGISINAVPFNMSEELLGLDEFQKGLKDLAEGMDKLNEGTRVLIDGSYEINDGLSNLSLGSGEYNEGIKSISQSGKDISLGSDQILMGLESINNEVKNLDNEELITGLTEISDNLQLLSQGLTAVKQGFITANQALGASIDQIPDTLIDEADLALIAQNNPGDSNVTLLIQYYEAAVRVKATYAAVSNNYASLYSSIDDINYGIGEIVDSIDLIITGLNENDIEQLVNAIDSIYDNYYTFNLGLSNYVKGIEKASDSYEDINNGLIFMSNGYDEFVLGLEDIGDGINEINDNTKKIPGEIQEMTELLDSSDYRPVSFASKDNGEIKALQFIMKTKGIEKDEIEEEKPTEKEELSFWQRLIRLFIKD